jgi:hypothetical protein
MINFMSFEWQTEEDIHWDEPPLPEEKPTPEPRQWRRLGLYVLLVVVLLGLTAVYITYRELNRRIE